MFGEFEGPQQRARLVPRLVVFRGGVGIGHDARARLDEGAPPSMTIVRIAMQKSRLPAKSRYPTAPA